ncbi:hypothetical protein GQ457_13G002570 [Hibiscus cannabinus]
MTQTNMANHSVFCNMTNNPVTYATSIAMSEIQVSPMANGRVSMKDSVSRREDDQNTMTAAVIDEVIAILSDITNALKAALLINIAMPASGLSFLKPPGMVKAAVNVNVARRVDIIAII